MISFASGFAVGVFMGVGGTFLLLLFLAVLSDTPGKTLKEFSAAGVAITSGTILAISAFLYKTHVPKFAAMLLLLCVLLLIARQGVLLTTTICSALATIILSFVFFPPVGSFQVAEKDDRLALVLFFALSIVSCQLMSATKPRGNA